MGTGMYFPFLFSYWFLTYQTTAEQPLYFLYETTRAARIARLRIFPDSFLFCFLQGLHYLTGPRIPRVKDCECKDGVVH